VGGSPTERPRPSTLATSALGGLLGALLSAALVIGFTEVLKLMLALVSSGPPWALIVVPQLGLGLSVLVLYGFGRSEGAWKRASWARRWRTFPPGIARSDLTREMVAFAGEEERFPWRLAPLHATAIAATVGLGGPLGTEAPAAYLGVATGAALGDRGRWWRRLLRPAAVGGAAAGVAALMGVALVGTAYILELGRRHDAPLSAERVVAALVGGIVGWLMNVALHVDLIRLVVPKEPPHSFYQGVITALLIGALSGSITAIAGAAIYRAKAWNAHPAFRLAVGGVALCGAAIALANIAGPQAAVGPGGGAILWVESAHTDAMTVLAVALLRAAATISGAAAGGCGGLFVPFLAVGDLGGRVFAHMFGVPDDLAGSAGAASGIAGGYRLPFTAVAVVLGQGGPYIAMLCCLATIVVATAAGAGAASFFERVLGLGESYLARRAPPPQRDSYVAEGFHTTRREARP
jgi:H+/Cl- antiporter ClcA